MNAMSSRLPVCLLALFTLADGTAGADEIKASAAWGEPFGVGRVELVTTEKTELFDDVRSIQLRERDGRALYLVVSNDGKPLSRIKSVSTNSVVVHFLFRGKAPLDVTMTLPDGRRRTDRVIPEGNDDLRKKLLDGWWNQFRDRAQTEWRQGELSEGLERYLMQMLPRRLDYSAGRLPRTWNSAFGSDLIVGLLAGTDSIRGAMQSRRFLKGTDRTEKPVHLLPKGVEIPAVPVPDVPEDVVIEPIAMHVPDDCFYLRCGSFQNFLWLRSNVELWGSRVRDLAIRRPIDQGIRDKLERQFALKETVVARLFGKSVISDVALIGADTFLREGAAVGIVFEAKNPTLLTAQITTQRATALTSNETATEETIEIAGRKVSFLSTPDNAVRSFYVADGPYHLVTNSRTLVADFLRAGRGERSLGKLKEFRHSRDLMPVSPDQSAFIYMPDAFFRRLVSPHYRVEMTRRTLAMSEIESVQYARLAAQAEEQPHETIEDLIEGGFLEKEFLTRPDGSHVVQTDSQLVDSLRGGHGTFLPITDVVIDRITPTENNKYEQFRQEYRRLWTRVDPVTIGVTRKVVGPDRERVVFDIHITPVMKQRVGFLQMYLAAADTKRFAPIKGDFISAQFPVRPNIFGPNQNEKAPPAFRLFGGMRAVEIPFRFDNGEVREPDGFNTAPFYVGATPPVYLLGGNAEKADKDGYYRQGQRGLFSFEWGRKFDKFHVRGSTREMLEEVTPQLKLVDAERPAQIRFSIGDPKKTPYVPAFKAVGYTETRELSSRATKYLNRLTDVFGLEPQDARETGEKLLHAKLFCPLGGRYELSKPHEGFAEWRSTKWVTQSRRQIQEVPKDYQFPFLDWFHALDVEFRVNETTLRTRVEIETSRTALPGGSS